ncbi:ABC transporter substrate-binding protein [Desulfococcaceae bacterium HSG9]|nr:ABC transporter substrate-binding protein [Desulfococcaceae bacterium HSG9]
MKIRLTVTVVLGLLLGTAIGVYAATALETIKAPIDEIVTILKDPQYQDGARKDQQQAQLWPIIHQIFDFNLISRIALTRNNWKKFTPEQRKAFTNAFTGLLKNTYVDKMQGGDFKDVSVVFIEENKLSEKKSQVSSKIISREKELSVSYSLRLKKNRWRIYEVEVEDVRLIKNYREQFNRTLKTSSPAELIQQIEKKVAQRDKQ